jgi:hypothetical protein
MAGNFAIGWLARFDHMRKDLLEDYERALNAVQCCRIDIVSAAQLYPLECSKYTVDSGDKHHKPLRLLQGTSDPIEGFHLFDAGKLG